MGKYVHCNTRRNITLPLGSEFRPRRPTSIHLKQSCSMYLHRLSTILCSSHRRPRHPDPQRSDNWGKSYLSDVLTHCLSISRSQRPSLLDLNVRLAPSHIRIEWTGVESQSVTDAVAIFHDAHVEIHSLNGHEVWQFGIYTSEQVANLVLSDRGFDTSVVNDLTACGARSLMVLLDFVSLHPYLRLR